MKSSIVGVLLCGALVLTGCSTAGPSIESSSTSTVSVTDRDLGSLAYPYDPKYTLLQAMSDKAQLSTIAFNGLAFITGSANADTFFPPGKVADFFGFQYMRDVDQAGYGHNTTFLTKAATTTLSLLSVDQRAKLVSLAKAQSPTYADFAYNRLTLINAFRRELEGNTPTNAEFVDPEAAADYASSLYGLDAELSIGRAQTVGSIINSFTQEQKDAFAQLKFDDSSTWLNVAEDEELKKSLTNTEYQAVMTYASELMSWYLGGVAADTYFCPERHGTYFGGFFMKDYPAMGNPDYFISTTVTGDKGQAFLEVLNSEQRALITEIIEKQRSLLNDMALTRWRIADLLRVSQTGDEIDVATASELIAHYGYLDGKVSALYAEQFSKVNSSLTGAQRSQLVALRDLAIVPTNSYRYATEVVQPTVSNSDFLFGVGETPADAGQIVAPSEFATGDLKSNSGKKPGKK